MQSEAKVKPVPLECRQVDTYRKKKKVQESILERVHSPLHTVLAFLIFMLNVINAQVRTHT